MVELSGGREATVGGEDGSGVRGGDAGGVAMVDEVSGGFSGGEGRGVGAGGDSRGGDNDAVALSFDEDADAEPALASGGGAGLVGGNATSVARG
jgi:hypothetical protein